MSFLLHTAKLNQAYLGHTLHVKRKKITNNNKKKPHTNTYNSEHGTQKILKRYFGKGERGKEK